MVFGPDAAPVAMAQQEFAQIYPQRRLGRARSGRALAHDGRDDARGGRQGAGATPASPRSASPTSARRRWSGTGAPASRSTTPSSGRTGAPRRPARAEGGGRRGAGARRTGLLLDPYFSATKIAWILDNVAARARAGRARRTRLRHGRFLSDLAADRRRRRTPPTPPTPRAPCSTTSTPAQWDDELLRLFRVPRVDAARGAGHGRRFRRDRARSLGVAAAHSGGRRRPAGRADRPGLLRAGHGEGDLRHRRLPPAQHRREARRLARTGC